MKLIDFIAQFPDEESCRTRFKEYRDRVGVTCSKCGCKVHYWVGGKQNHYECKQCGHRQSLRANTVMHNSHLPFRVWFIAMHLITSTKSAFSTLEIQRQMSTHHSYRAIWWMVQKLRAIMGKSEDEHKLSGEVEIDEAFFKLEPIKNIHTREHLTPVVVMAESEDHNSEINKERIKRKFGHLKMKVTNSISAASIKEIALKCIDKSAILRSDGTNCHRYIINSFREVSLEVLKDQSDLLRVLPWVHINIGHSKNQINDIYHCVRSEYLQLYLDYFCFKRNNRYVDIFDKLCCACAKYSYVWRPMWKRFDLDKFLMSNLDRFDGIGFH